jgi:hypothetical protein
LPAGSTLDSYGHALHGWQTALLPWLERKNLYERIDITQPWDSFRNATCFKEQVTEFLNPSLNSEPIDSSGYAATHYSANEFVLGGTDPRRDLEFGNGKSKVIVAGEAAGNFPPWGRPGNWRDPRFGLDQSPDGFGGGRRTGDTMVLMGDGSVRAFTASTDQEVFRSMADPNQKPALSTDR